MFVEVHWDAFTDSDELWTRKSSSAALACQLPLLNAVIDLILYYCFSCSPLTPGTRLWVGAVCVCG